ncbi:7462_t:CDS:1, partial [Ambispora leptoticha]
QGPTTSTVLPLSNKLYILDTKNYPWVTTFNPIKPKDQIPPATNNSNNANNNSNVALFIGIGVGVGIVLSGIFSFLGYLLYKRCNQYPKFIPTPGSTHGQCYKNN